MKLISLKNRIGADNRRHLSANGFSLLPLALRPRLFSWSAMVAGVALALIAGCVIDPPKPALQTYADDPAPAEDPSITISTAGTIAANLSPTSSSGNFASASGTFSVTTTNELGYTLKIKSTNNGTDLKYTDTNNNNAVYTIPTLNANAAISESDFSTSSTYNNKWGYKPSKLYSMVNNNYIPAPSTDGDTLDVTEEANVEANNYTISLGARVNNETKVGNYANNFVIEATANVAEVVPAGLRVDFNGNGLTFANGRSTNTLAYDVVNNTETITIPSYQYIASCNVVVKDNKDGTFVVSIKDGYTGCKGGEEVVTVKGADHLVVGLSWDLADKDSLNIYKVDDKFYGRSGKPFEVGFDGKMTFKPEDCAAADVCFDRFFRVSGDTAAIMFHKDSPVAAIYAGYVVVVAGDDENGSIIGETEEITTTTYDQIYGTYTTPTVPSAYNFLGWSTNPNATTDNYTSLSQIEEAFGNGLSGSSGDTVTLYAIYQKNYTIHYVANGAIGSTTMGDQVVTTSGNDVTLWASNFQRPGYGFAGWNTAADGSGTNYGPNQTITMASSELTLYAKWVLSAGDLQNWTCPNNTNMPIGTVTALTDTRDDQTYAVAKLADGNCWMIENLRLDYNSVNSNWGNDNLSQGFGGVFTGLAAPETTNFSNSTVANSLYSTANITGDSQVYRFPRYNNNNTANPVSNMTNTSSNIYSYGNYYTWAAAIADTTAHNSSSDVINTSICPAGWHLPYGNSGTGANGGNTSGGFYYLNYKLNNDSNATDSTASGNLRTYPNNFVYSGSFSSSNAYDRGRYGFYWSSSADSSSSAYDLSLRSAYVSPGTASGNKGYGRSVRCVLGS